jgi:hypothetical protein
MTPDPLNPPCSTCGKPALAMHMQREGGPILDYQCKMHLQGPKHPVWLEWLPLSIDPGDTGHHLPD